jgi:hypothetical protein
VILTSIQMSSWETSNINIVGDFLIFPTVDNPSSYGQRFESYDLWKWTVVAEILFWTEQDTWIILEFEPTSNEKLEEL